MESNLQHQMSSGLTRYRSAPSSYFATLLDATTGGGGGGGDGVIGGGYLADDLDHLINSRVSNRDVFSRIMENVGTQESNPTTFGSNIAIQSNFGVSMKPEREIQQQQERVDYSFMPKMYQSQTQTQHGHNLEASNSAIDNSYRLVASINPDRVTQMKTSGGDGVRNSNLIRHSSSPAGLFDQIDMEYEYGAIRGMGNFSGSNNLNAKASVSSSSSMFKKDMVSTLGEMTPIAEIEVKGESSYISDFTNSPWDDSPILSDDFLKGLGDSDHKLFSSINASSNTHNEVQNRPQNLLTHHLSLPTSASEMSVLEKLSEDTVLCKTRAKRGFATHPRSIAERVRRTRISDRMRKLQDLVPNMDKQTNTADMLDLAVDYIKDLEKELKAIQENRAKCTCSKT